MKMKEQHAPVTKLHFYQSATIIDCFYIVQEAQAREEIYRRSYYSTGARKPRRLEVLDLSTGLASPWETPLPLFTNLPPTSPRRVLLIQRRESMLISLKAYFGKKRNLSEKRTQMHVSPESAEPK